MTHPSATPGSAQDTPVSAALDLYDALDKAFTAMDCRKALVICSGDRSKAAAWLTEGGWRTAKLISWDHTSLDEKARALEAELQLPGAQVRQVLMNCAGSTTLARRVLQHQPVLG